MTRNLFFCCTLAVAVTASCRVSSFAGDNTIGTTFSQVQCEYFGMDWKELYGKVMEMHFAVIRLGAYWRKIEKNPGVYDFTELDHQVRLAARHNKDILLVVGMKSPRWPEYFIPEWLMEDIPVKFGGFVTENDLLKEKVMLFITETVNRYKDEQAIIAWQVENEPFNRAGPRDWRISEAFLLEEIKAVRGIDDRGRPVVVNALTYANKFLRFLSFVAYRSDPVFKAIDVADIPALNVYPVIGHTFLKAKLCFRTHSEERSEYLERFVSYARELGKQVWVTEFQAEPWEPGQLVHVKEGEAVTCRPQNITAGFKELAALGIDTVFLWGVEYWFFREQTFGDDSWLAAVQEILSKR